MSLHNALADAESHAGAAGTMGRALAEDLEDLVALIIGDARTRIRYPERPAVRVAFSGESEGKPRLGHVYQRVADEIQVKLTDQCRVNVDPFRKIIVTQLHISFGNLVVHLRHALVDERTEIRPFSDEVAVAEFC